MTKTLYVGNLPWSVTEDDLARCFAEYTEVISARVITDRETGRSRGFGFVEVPEDKARLCVEKLDGAEWEGRLIRVNEAQPRNERPARREGGRRQWSF